MWRLRNKDNIEIPDNVLIADWLPQNEILANNNTKLFITHCGSNGQFESVYHAVPMIGFPIYMDQWYNAKRIESKGYGTSTTSRQNNLWKVFERFLQTNRTKNESV